MNYNFFKNFSLLSLSSGVSQLLTSLSILILTHFFSPNEIGKYSIVAITITFFSFFFHFRADALILIKPINEAEKISLSLKKICYYNFFIYQSLFILVYSLYHFDEHFLFTPLFTFTLAYFAISREINIKRGLFAKDTLDNSARGVILISLQVLSGLIYPWVPLLNLGKSLSEFYYVYKSQGFIKTKLSYREAIKQFKLLSFYSNEFLPLLGNKIIQNLSNNSIPFWWTYHYGYEKNGVLYMALKVVQLPGNIIGETLAKLLEIRLQESSREKHTTELAKFFVFSFSICLLTCISIYLFVPAFIDHFLSTRWLPALQYIIYLIPFACVNILNNSIISLFKYKKNVNKYNAIETFEALSKNLTFLAIPYLMVSELQVLILFTLLCLVFTGIKFLVAIKNYV